MYTKIKIGYRLLLVISCGIGLALLLGIFSGQFDTNQLIFYTIQSNLLIFFGYLYLVVRSLTRSLSTKKAVAFDFSPNIMGALTLIIVITGLIYNFILVPSIPSTSEYAVNSLSDFLVHTSTPVMAFIDWLLFADTKELKKIKPLTWTILPLLYWLFTIVRAQIGGPIAGFDSYYPYFFIDAVDLGWPRVFLNVLILLLFFVAFGYLMKLIARGTNYLKPARSRQRVY